MEIRVETRDQHIAVVTIENEPRRNAMSRAMLADLAALWDRLEADHSCRCVVLTGAGDKAFSSGADLAGDLSAGAETAHVVNRALLKNTPFPKPIVAAVNGDCVAGGLELLLSTDIRAAAPEARFGLPEVKWSIYPFGGATVKLAQQIALLVVRIVFARPVPQLIPERTLLTGCGLGAAAFLVGNWVVVHLLPAP